MQSSLSSVRLLRRAQNIRSWCHLKTLAQTRPRSSVWRPLPDLLPGVRYLSLGCARFNTTGLSQEELSLLGLESSSSAATSDVAPLSADISEATVRSGCDVSSVDGAGATAPDAEVLTAGGAGVDGGQLAGGYVSPFEATGDFTQVTNALAEPTFHSMG